MEKKKITSLFSYLVVKDEPDDGTSLNTLRLYEMKLGIFHEEFLLMLIRNERFLEAREYFVGFFPNSNHLISTKNTNSYLPINKFNRQLYLSSFHRKLKSNPKFNCSPEYFEYVQDLSKIGSMKGLEISILDFQITVDYNGEETIKKLIFQYNNTVKGYLKSEIIPVDVNNRNIKMEFLDYLKKNKDKDIFAQDNNVVVNENEEENEVSILGKRARSHTPEKKLFNSDDEEVARKKRKIYEELTEKEVQKGPKIYGIGDKDFGVPIINKPMIVPIEVFLKGQRMYKREEFEEEMERKRRKIKRKKKKKVVKKKKKVKKKKVVVKKKKKSKKTKRRKKYSDSDDDDDDDDYRRRKKKKKKKKGRKKMSKLNEEEVDEILARREAELYDDGSVSDSDDQTYNPSRSGL